MAEYSYAALQTVEAGQNVLFNETPVAPSRCIVHRDGSGIVTLRGLTNCQCRARFRVSFGANIAIPTGGTVGAISVALAIAGEPLPASKAIVTPAAADNYFNVYIDTFVDVPAGCCATVAVENTNDKAISVQNTNLIKKQKNKKKKIIK